MKKLFLALVFVCAAGANAYFDGGLNYTSGSTGYKGKDIYVLIGSGNWWIKPEYSTYENDRIDMVSKYSARVGLEGSAYTLSFVGGLMPEKLNTENKFLGADITFSLNPTSSSKKRMAGPNAGFNSRSASGVTQIDVGAGVNVNSYTNNSTDRDLLQADYSLFAGAKIMMAQLSGNYTLSKYSEDIHSSLAPLNSRYAGLNTYVGIFPKSNLNLRLDFLSYPMVTPFVSYSKTKFKESGADDMNTYVVGAYIDLNMVGATVSYQTFKSNGKNFNFLSASAGIRF